MATSTRSDELTGLTGIRALAASWVVIEHFRLILFALLPETRALTPLVSSGFLGVEVFFVLSGFIISYRYADKFSTFSWTTYKHFMLLRFARIYPVHLVTLIGLALIVGVATLLGIALSGSRNYTFAAFIGNLFMLQALPGVSNWNNPAWSISTEFAAYLMFPVIALILVRIKRAWAGFAAASALSLAGVAAMLAIATVHDSATGHGMMWTRIGVEFTVGCFLYAGWIRLGRYQQGRPWDWVALVSAIAVALILLVVGGEGSVALIATPLIALFVLASAGATGSIGKFLSSRLMMWGGKVSYSVYMTHFILLMVLGDVLDPSRYADSSLLMRMLVIACYFAAAIGAGAFCYYFIEEPGRKWVRKLSARQESPRQLQPTSTRQHRGAFHR